MHSIAPLSPLSVQSTRRALQPLLRTAPSAWDAAEPLEQTVMRADAPQIAPCTPLERPEVRSIEEASAPLVRAFLDGVQRSRIVGHYAGAPLVYATVGAAVREREARTLHTWREPLLRGLLLTSQQALGADWWEHLLAAGVPLVDTDHRDGGSDGLELHPHAHRARALAQVALEREQLERQLAAQWCATQSTWLWIDGGIAGNLALTPDAPAFGVVKSHNTLYGDGEAIRRVLALRAGQRSPAFLVGHRVRRAVASWYLRLRDPHPNDPLFGLVRVEIVPPAAAVEDACSATDRGQLTAQCDRLSAAILLERHPVSLPDPRWHTLAYGVYAVETYLKAVIGP